MSLDFHVRRNSPFEKLRRELFGIVQSGYDISQGTPMVCSLHSADDFHRAMQVYTGHSVTYASKPEPVRQVLSFTAKFHWGSEGGFRDVRFELDAQQETKFREAYGPKYKLPERHIHIS